MSEGRSNAGAAKPLPKARIKRGRPAWLLWLIPLGAAALCVWFVYRDYVATGPAISIYFHNAEGLEEGNTQVNYRGAQVGLVKSLELTEDQQQVKVKVRLVSSAKGLARAGSAFWIVRPEVKLGGISGLRTIISGEYIAVEPGGGSPTNSFQGADKAPSPEQPGSLHLLLLAPRMVSLREQTPILYRGIAVGEVLAFQLGKDAQEVIIQARIRPEYAPLVRVNSRFWNAGGIDFTFSLLRGLRLSAESPETLLAGGIEFASPPDLKEAASDGAAFVLHDKPEEAWKQWSPAIKLSLPAPTNQPAATNGLMTK
jgi:paraquat-inducible protein B